MTVKEDVKDLLIRFEKEFSIQLEAYEKGRLWGSKVILLTQILIRFNNISTAIYYRIQHAKDFAVLSRISEIVVKAKNAKSFEKAAAKFLANS
jgi:hypothetical protein